MVKYKLEVEGADERVLCLYPVVLETEKEEAVRRKEMI